MYSEGGVHCCKTRTAAMREGFGKAGGQLRNQDVQSLKLKQCEALTAAGPAVAAGSILAMALALAEPLSEPNLKPSLLSTVTFCYRLH